MPVREQEDFFQWQKYESYKCNDQEEREPELIVSRARESESENKIRVSI